MAKNQRQYTEEDKAIALATVDANGGNIKKTAKLLNIPERTLNDWFNRKGINPAVATSRDIKKGELSAKLEDVAWKLTENLSIRAESELSVLVPMKDIATSLGIVVDKMQLLKGKPTAINGTQEKRAEYESLVERILKRAKDRGENTTRDEVVSLIVERKPEARDYLM